MGFAVPIAILQVLLDIRCLLVYRILAMLVTVYCGSDSIGDALLTECVAVLQSLEKKQPLSPYMIFSVHKINENKVVQSRLLKVRHPLIAET